MSNRQLRKLIDPMTLPLLEEDSEDEFEPLYANTPVFTYQGLEINDDDSNNSDDNGAWGGTEDSSDEEIKKKRKKRKKKKQRKCKLSCVVRGSDKLDEIDRAVLEVNAVLGTPTPPATPPGSPERELDPRKIMFVQSKYLSYRFELKKMVGTDYPDEEEGEIRIKEGHRTRDGRKTWRPTIIPMPEDIHFERNGFSMSLLRIEKGVSYFVFNHSREYQMMHRDFIDLLLDRKSDYILVEERDNVHVEGLLHTADIMFHCQEYTEAKNILEHIIRYMQYVAHPLFNLTNRTHRLEYKYAENRPFFVAVLKHLHMLTNKSLNRSALELAKLLLNLDPTDPLAIIYIIDVIALRGKEYQWLVDFVQYWSRDKHTHHLFNIKYSYALAHFHLDRINKTHDLSTADCLLKVAIHSYPNIAFHILAVMRHEMTADLQKHPLFNNPFASIYKPPDYLNVAMTMYAKLVYPRFRETAVLKWFLRNLTKAMEQFDTDPNVLKRMEDTLDRSRASFFPGPLCRHLLLIGPMMNLLTVWDGPPMRQSRRAWDPLPPRDGVHRYVAYEFRKR